MALNLPLHLRKYIVTQNYEKYTPVDQAVWRYILRQLRAFLSKHAHECYIEGLEKTGISVERIPRIEEVSEKLEKFGWRALPVSGFIPPAAFMELQALGVLPIASDMRSLDHLLYTPAPDIVHEAAGHAPILIHPEFAQYLKNYATVARKAIISKEDLDLYEAIRDLSDLKEDPNSTSDQIQKAEAHLNHVSKSISHISEASLLSRMNWWTAEYGLIGSIESPRIFGAGLLSSVGESRWCLSDKVKKIPLSVDCLNYSYDITEPQPQLFVAKDFSALNTVLDEMASQMAFKVGGAKGLDKAITAQTVNTIELSSGLQISGVVKSYQTDSHGVCYVQAEGPTQLSYQDQELPGHNKEYHAHGFGSPVGTLKKFPSTCPSQLSNLQLQELGVVAGETCDLEFTSGLKVHGKVKSITQKNQRILLVSLENATAKLGDRVFFEPAWGTYDMALADKVVSVYGGPADRVAYGETEDFVAKKVAPPRYTQEQLTLHGLYQKIRNIREQNTTLSKLDEISEVLTVLAKSYPLEWLLRLEVVELTKPHSEAKNIYQKAYEQLQTIAKSSENQYQLVQDGLNLVER